METIGVVGFGLMGAGIAQVSAQAGYRVIASDISDDVLVDGHTRIERILKIEVRRKNLSDEEKDAILERIATTTNLADMAGCDMVIEAATERLETKKQIFEALEGFCGEETILATNTSSLPLAEIARALKRRERFAGIHFFNPVTAMELVEVARTLDTADAVYEAIEVYIHKLGKKLIQVPDSPAFIVNALLVPYLIDAVRMLERGIGSKEDIDEAVKLGLGYPMGPFELMDHVGIDTAHHIAEILYEENKDPRYAPPNLLKQLYRSGRLGRKTGEGFYKYGKK